MAVINNKNVSIKADINIAEGGEIVEFTNGGTYETKDDWTCNKTYQELDDMVTAGKQIVARATEHIYSEEGEFGEVQTFNLLMTNTSNDTEGEHPFYYWFVHILPQTVDGTDAIFAENITLDENNVISVERFNVLDRIRGIKTPDAELTPDSDGKVTIPYAKGTSSGANTKAGMIKPAAVYGTYVENDGTFVARIFSKSQYKSNVYNFFIGKTTLENIKSDYVSRGLCASEISGYEASNTQVLKHDDSGHLFWEDAGE